MGNIREVFFRTIALSLTWILNAQTPWGGKVMAGFTSFTTSGGVHYLLSDFTAGYSSVSSQCASQNADMPTFTDNAEYQDFADYLKDSGAHDSKQIWVTITKSGTKFYFSGGEEINDDHWFDDEPNHSCSGTCCYRVVKIIHFSVESKHNIADNSCTKNYYVLCKGSVTTTTTTTPTTTTTTTTPLSPPTTTPITTTITTPTTPPPTTPTTTSTTSAPTTSLIKTTTPPPTTPTTTSTTSAPTTSLIKTTTPPPTTPTTTSTTSAPTTSLIKTTTAPTTTTTTPTTVTTSNPIISTTTASTTTQTTATTTNPTTATTLSTTPPTTVRTRYPITTPTTASSAVPSSNEGAEEPVDLTTGEQMTILYLGFIVGGSILISCICSCCWLAINRGIRRRRKQYELEKEKKDGEKDTEESDKD